MGFFKKKRTRGHTVAKAFVDIVTSTDKSSLFMKKFNIPEEELSTVHFEYILLATFTVTFVASCELEQSEQDHFNHLFHDMIKERYKVYKKHYDLFLETMGVRMISYFDLIKNAGQSAEMLYHLIGKNFAIHCKKENDQKYEKIGEAIFDNIIDLTRSIMHKEKGYLFDPVKS